jgi:CubicO group peptidase (beta-lactamase class C family)
MQKHFLFFLVCIILAQPIFAQTNDKRIVALEPQLEKLTKDWKAAGFAVAVVDKNGIIYSKGFGYRDVEKKLPVTPNTLFAIGSCTKAFTASLVGLIANDKLVDIDKPIQTYLPSLHFFNNEMTEDITLRDMMSHRTGLPRHDISWYMFPTASRDSLLMRIQYMEPSAGIKEKWQYNNFMFFLQGMVAEKLTGKSWEENIQTKFFDPLKMARSNFSVIDMQKDADASLGYGLNKDSNIKKLSYYNINSMGPAGSINSSVTEMSHWVTSWINGGKYNGKEILPGTYTQQAIGSQMVIAPALPTKEIPDVYFSNYGFGWFLASYRGHYRVEHGGNIDGFSASTSFFPTDSIGIIVLTNQDGSALPGVIRNLISDKLLKLPYKDWSAEQMKAIAKNKALQAEAIKSSSSNRKFGTTTSHPLKDYGGLYSNAGYGTFEVFVKNDSLFLSTPNKLAWLKHYHYDMFEPFIVDPVDGIDTVSSSPPGQDLIQFTMDTKGDINAALAAFEPTLKPIEFTKKDKEVSLSKETLEKYEGEYQLAGMTMKVHVKDNKLFVFVPGQTDYELAAVGSDKFNMEKLQGFSLQFHMEDGKAVAVSFIQPNGTFKAIRKK